MASRGRGFVSVVPQRHPQRPPAFGNSLAGLRLTGRAPTQLVCLAGNMRCRCFVFFCHVPRLWPVLHLMFACLGRGQACPVTVPPGHPRVTVTTVPRRDRQLGHLLGGRAGRSGLCPATASARLPGRCRMPGYPVARVYPATRLQVLTRLPGRGELPGCPVT